jgi:uncharacterized membrane protein YbaN (DUF454 family)
VPSGAKTVTSILIQHNCFINHFHAFLIIRNLGKHSKINNIRFMTLMMIYDFLQVQGNKRGYLIKYDYFSKQEEIIMICPL